MVASAEMPEAGVHPPACLRLVAPMTTVRLLVESNPSRWRSSTPSTRRVASCISARASGRQQGARGWGQWLSRQEGDGASGRQDKQRGSASDTEALDQATSPAANEHTRPVRHPPVDLEVARASSSSRKMMQPSGNASHVLSMSAGSWEVRNGGVGRGQQAGAAAWQWVHVLQGEK